MFKAPRSFAGPVPDRSNSLGESTAPAARITSRPANTSLELALSLYDLKPWMGSVELHCFSSASTPTALNLLVKFFVTFASVMAVRFGGTEASYAPETITRFPSWAPSWQTLIPIRLPELWSRFLG